MSVFFLFVCGVSSPGFTVRAGLDTCNASQKKKKKKKN